MLPTKNSSLFRGHIRELDGLRGIAILQVMTHHFWPKQGLLEFLNKVVFVGWTGVDLFFVISGFLITGILLDTQGDSNYYKNFYARRGLRIFPLYYAFLLAAFTLIPLCQRGSYFSTEFLRESGSPLWYLFYCGNVREAVVGIEPAYILAPLWSLSIEEQFYLAFPILVAICSRGQLAKVMIACILSAPLWRAIMVWAIPENERIQYVATFSRVDVIAWGALIAIGFRSDRILSVQWTNRLFIGAIIVSSLTLYFGGLDRTRLFCRIFGYSIVGATLALFELWAIQNRSTSRTAWLRFAPLCHLGGLCYGIYLLQRPTEVVLGKTLVHCHSLFFG